MKGRKPKPTKLKVIQGTFRKDRANPDEPTPETHIPSPPDFLNADALQEWGRMSEKLYQLGMLAEIDRGIFAAYCQAFGRWAEAERAIKEKGLFIKTSNGNIIQSPAVGMANKAMKEMRDAASLMGIPATMRSKVHPLEGKKQTKKNGFAEF
jgi:P27 family predicted phage terminase small subunit